MGSECRGTNTTKTNNFPEVDIISRNIYDEANKPYTQDYSKFFVSKASQVKYSSILSKLDQSKAKTFKDKNFIIPNSIKLSLLYNYENMRAKIFAASEDTPYTCFTQTQIQFTYLACTFYLFCKLKYKLNDIFQTRVINDYDMYVLRLFCNGSRFDVVIDDMVPVEKESLKYCSLIKGRQIWPVLLEKAWCKQIGGYQQAKGLSPQDAFEQITGIPAYSYDMKYELASQLEQNLEQNLKKGYWIALTAKQNLRDLESRQVFYLQNIQGNKIHIRSPYNRYNFGGKPIEDSNMVKINLQQLTSHFQFCTIGYTKPEFQTISIKHQSKSKEEVIYELQITKQEEVNIRFIQYYDGYLPIEKRAMYQYSPLSIEVYNEEYYLQQHLQGCPRAQSGARSAHFSPNIMQVLRRGKYYIKIQVDWINDSYFNKGAICVYTKKQNASIRLSDEKTKDLLQKFHKKLLKNHENPQQITENVQLRRADKKNGLILQFKNKGKNMQRIKLDLSKSKNVRMKYCESVNSVTTLVMEPNQQRNIEVVPMDLREILSIESFEVSKV